MKTRTPTDERRRGIPALIASAVVLDGMLAPWWLAAPTNWEGHHDAELLPIFTAMPLGIALWYFAVVVAPPPTTSTVTEHTTHRARLAAGPGVWDTPKVPICAPPVRSWNGLRSERSDRPYRHIQDAAWPKRDGILGEAIAWRR